MMPVGTRCITNSVYYVVPCRLTVENGGLVVILSLSKSLPRAQSKEPALSVAKGSLAAVTPF